MLVRRVFSALLLAAAISAGQPPSGWNRVQALPPGTEVRIRIARSNTIRGRLEAVGDASLTVNPGSTSRSIGRQQIAGVSVRTKARRRRSALIGLAIGAGGGAALGGSAASTCSGSICGGHGAAFVAGGTAGGALIGALIGAAVSHAGWREIYRQ